MFHAIFITVYKYHTYIQYFYFLNLASLKVMVFQLWSEEKRQMEKQKDDQKQMVPYLQRWRFNPKPRAGHCGRIRHLNEEGSCKYVLEVMGSHEVVLCPLLSYLCFISGNLHEGQTGYKKPMKRVLLVNLLEYDGPWINMVAMGIKIY